MNIFLIIIIIVLLIAIVLLSLSLFYFITKSTYFSDKEKDYLIFIIDNFKQHSEDLGIKSKDQYKKLCEELDKIKDKKLSKTTGIK